jgi:hypothetical protein
MPLGCKPGSGDRPARAHTSTGHDRLACPRSLRSTPGMNEGPSCSYRSWLRPSHPAAPPTTPRSAQVRAHPERVQEGKLSTRNRRARRTAKRSPSTGLGFSGFESGKQKHRSHLAVGLRASRLRNVRASVRQSQRLRSKVNLSSEIVLEGGSSVSQDRGWVRRRASPSRIHPLSRG